MSEDSLPPPQSWLLRWPEVFADWRGELLAQWGLQPVRRIGREYVLVRAHGIGALDKAPAAKWVSWVQPVHHLWPCNPWQTDGFVEKAAGALARKFAHQPLQALLVGALDPGNRLARSLASNLRGRALQLFSAEVAACREADAQAPDRPSLFVLVGEEGLHAGLVTPRAAGGFHPGGTRFIRQSGVGVISRAGAKVAEALHHLRLYRNALPEGAHWLDLGASPGGMTAELLARGCRVTAVDRAPLDPRLMGLGGLQCVTADVGDFAPPQGTAYDGILCDMNGETMMAFDQVLRLAAWLRPGGVAIFTLKLTGVSDAAGADALEAALTEESGRHGLEWLACRHLTYNRREFTCFLQRRAG